jgi:ABC-type ATPase with predicted acetyltransferase domain
MLGVIRQGDNVAIKVLDKLGADLSNLRARVTQELRNDPEDQDAPAAEREQRRVRVILHDTVQSLLDTIDDRLSAIERHLGMDPGGPENVIPPS